MFYRTYSAAALAGVLLAGPAFAQTTAPTSPAQKGPAPAADQKMSAADKTAWTKCKAMTPEVMKANEDCARIAKAYPHSGKWAKDQAPNAEADRK